jgi:signal transduction histidine kinase
MSVTNTPDQAGTTRVDPGQVELILSQIESLPTLPAVAGRLLEMTLDDRCGTGEIAALISSDQTLSARILSLARKANVGLEAQTVDRAVVLLGCDVVRSLVLGVQVFEMFSHRAERSTSRFDRPGFWRHSLAVGCAARLIAAKRLAAPGKGRPGVPAPEEAFVCGLLHDLGKVVFDACFPKSYDRVIEKVETRRADIADVEREVFGVDHAVAGHRLAVHWKLPRPAAECMWLHHQTPQSTPTRITFAEHVLLVQVADRLVRQMHIGYSGNYALGDLGGDLATCAGLDAAAMADVMLELPDLIEARAQLLGLQDTTSREVLHETLVRTNAELARVNAELALANRTLEQRSRTLDGLCVFNKVIGDDCRHETVMQAVVQALRPLAAGTSLAAFVSSPARHLTIVAWQAAGQEQVGLQVLPNSVVGNLEGVFSQPGRNAADLTLPPAILDRLPAPPGENGTQSVWPLRCDGRLVAGVAAGGAVSDGLEQAINLLADWAGSRLNAAESSLVTHQLSEELAEMNRRFVNSRAEAARMRSLAMVGEMAAGAAHELNNPLAVISGRGQLLARVSEDEEVTKSANIIAEHAHRASAIVNELMEFAKPSPPKPTTWGLTDLLGEIRRAWLDKKVLAPGQFVLELSDDLPRIHADASQIRLLFDELIRNAVEAMQDRQDRRLTVNCRGDVADERLVVRIEDNGCGMNPDVLERAMDPFFSHRPAGRGRGLGLSRAARYAEINGGRIRLSSRVKEGTAVIVELPAAAER